MPTAVADLTPTTLWSRFDELTTVPRPSKREEQVRAWVRAWAEVFALFPCVGNEAFVNEPGNGIV